MNKEIVFKMLRTNERISILKVLTYCTAPKKCKKERGGGRGGRAGGRKTDGEIKR